jgi:PTS system N-acetylgalactosamine-specific IIA component
MIGLIITGHGEFAAGLSSAVNILAGKPEKFIPVNFQQEDSTDDLEISLKQAIRELADCHGILILTDLVNASPYKIAAGLAGKLKATHDIQVVGGTSLGMLMQINMARGYVNDVNDLADLAVEEGRRQILKYEEFERPVGEHHHDD